MHLYHKCDLRGTIAEAVVADALSSQLEYMCTHLSISEDWGEYCLKHLVLNI